MTLSSKLLGRLEWLRSFIVPVFMDERTVPKVSKWPFLLGDLLFVILGAAIIWLSNHPIGLWQTLVSLTCVGAGAWLGVMPFIREHGAELKLAEAETLASSVAQIHNLEQIANQIGNATSQWQAIQEHANNTCTSAQGIAEKVASEAKAFTEFLQRANDSEKANLRLEVDKLRRAEGEWLQIVIRLLDHIFALNQAAVRSGQSSLIEQLGHFQNACRDVARRAGLVPFVVSANEAFDEKIHQVMDPDGKPSPSARVCETIATGFTYQGQLLRRAVVSVQSDITESPGDVSGDQYPGQQSTRDQDAARPVL